MLGIIREGSKGVVFLFELFMQSVIIFILITLGLSAIFGWLCLVLNKSNINTQEKRKFFKNSTVGGFIAGLFGAFIGHYLGLKSASTVDGLFIALAGIARLIEYLKFFLPCWILSILGGAIYHYDFFK
ncbi:MAG: hypothetical protein AAGA16_16360 [Cyanobacteria bacterium P01_E01_bin.35]